MATIWFFWKNFFRRFRDIFSLFACVSETIDSTAFCLVLNLRQSSELHFRWKNPNFSVFVVFFGRNTLRTSLSIYFDNLIILSLSKVLLLKQCRLPIGTSTSANLMHYLSNSDESPQAKFKKRSRKIIVWSK